MVGAVETAHAAEQQRVDVKAAREAWFEASSTMLVLNDETVATTKIGAWASAKR